VTRTPGYRDRVVGAMDDEWRTASELADRAGLGRRGAGQVCATLVLSGFALEEKRSKLDGRGDKIRAPSRYRRNPEWSAP
jgi:hypothetical protein